MMQPTGQDDPNRTPTSAEYLAIVPRLRAAGGIELSELEGGAFERNPSVAALASVLLDKPPYPGVRRLASWGVSMPEQNQIGPVDVVTSSFDFCNELIIALSGIYPEAGTEPAANDIRAIFAELHPIFRDGSVTKITNAIERNAHLGWLRPVLMQMLPVALLHVMTVSLAQDASDKCPEHIVEPHKRNGFIASSVRRETDAIVKKIVTGYSIDTKKGSQCRQVAMGAAEALRSYYKLAARSDLATEALQTITTIYALADIREGNDTRLGSILSGFAEIGLEQYDIDSYDTQVNEELVACGFDPRAIADSSLDRAKLASDVVTANVNKSAFIDRYDKLIKRIDVLHYAQAIVRNLQSGSLDYMQILEVMERLYGRVLGNRAALAQEQRQQMAEQAVAAERERIERALNELIASVNPLDWEIFPTPEREESAPQERRAAHGDNESLTAANDIEPLRLATLTRLQGAWPYPGTKIWRSKLKSTGGKRADVDPRLEAYYVLLLPHPQPDGRVLFHAVAECAKNNNPAIVLRGESGEDWKEVFKDHKSTALSHSALPIRHPWLLSYDRRPIETVDRFADRIFGTLAMSYADFIGLVLASRALRGTIDVPGAD